VYFGLRNLPPEVLTAKHDPASPGFFALSCCI